ncbi:MAG: hypothetical protein ACREOO_04055 [bacterium]
MRLKLFKYLDFAIMLLALVWLARTPDWEPLIAFFVALGAFIASDLAIESRYIAYHKQLMQDNSNKKSQKSKVSSIAYDAPNDNTHRKTHGLVDSSKETIILDLQNENRRLHARINKLTSLRTRIWALLNHSNGVSISFILEELRMTNDVEARNEVTSLIGMLIEEGKIYRHPYLDGHYSVKK